ncbi:DDE-type integrase/transposase/recombinase [Thiocapsa rosea]|uniref:Integrase-like protein n=1 Tax=Thiocapsa rosea TaxID=69360 RepID=A0A495V598_9GAMM|nr:DDE-type integrase/transposase/recombinase [Thiocapsa rosea]RKT44509.1 integrase-like protein [Thiocapsa rosea]
MSRRSSTLSPEAEFEILRDFNAGDDARKAVIAKYQALGYSAKTVYRVAKDLGWDSGRKPRADRGTIRIPGVDDAAIENCALVQLEATRKRTGKGLMCAEDIITQMALNGHEEFLGMTPSTLNRHLRRRELDHASLTAGNPATAMRSTHPNQIGFLDASICVQWDLKGSAGRMVSRDMERSFYKNKPGYWKTVRKVLVRWLYVDHFSGAFWVDYTYAGGENTADMISFLLDAWAPKRDPERYPLQGVPEMLGLDPGAANMSHETQNLCKRLGVTIEKHAPGNSRASGVVEKAHSFWEQRFEYELLLKLADSLEDLRERAWDRALYLNSNLKHSRHKTTRFLKWNEIKEGQLKILPPKDHCMRLATGRAEERVPNEQLRISVDGTEYQLSAPARKRRKVMFDRDPWNVGELANVWVELEGGVRDPVPCRRIVKDGAGFDETAPVYGEGRYRSHPDTPAMTLKKLSPDERAARLGGFEPKPTSVLVPDVVHMPKRGTPMTPEIPAAPPVPAVHVRRQVRERLGLERLTPQQGDMITGLLAGREAITESELDELIAQFEANLKATEGGARVSVLRVVGGGGMR